MKFSTTLGIIMVAALTLCGRPALCGELMVAAGAGYKRPLAKVYRTFEEQTGLTMSPVYGNMLQVLALVKRSGRVGVAIGDRSFLAGSKLFASFTPLGHGKLVIIYTKSHRLRTFHDIFSKQIVHIAMPDPKKAVYGRAAAQFLEYSGIRQQLSDKLLVTATVPQVSGFVISGAAEAGFVNITDAIAMRESIGGWLEVPTDLYDPIVIGMAVTKGWADRPKVAALVNFMKGATARKILRQYGL